MDKSNELKQLESVLLSKYVNHSLGNVRFHQRFTQVYSKMLELGSDPKKLILFEDGGSCIGDLAQATDLLAATKFS